MKLYRIKKSKIDSKGRGLYATKDIKAGTKIINYIGKIITNRKVDESNKFDNKKPIYLFTLNKKYTLDGDFPWNTAGLINHSCNNNCDYEGKGFKVWVTAIKDIKKVRNLPVTMVLVMTMTINSSLVNADLKIAVVILLELNLGGELIENSHWLTKIN